MLKFWNFGFCKSNRCKIGVNALTQSPPSSARAGTTRGRGGDWMPISPVPEDSVKFQSHRSPKTLSNFGNGSALVLVAGPLVEHAVPPLVWLRTAPGPWCGASVGTIGSAPCHPIRQERCGIILELWASKNATKRGITLWSGRRECNRIRNYGGIILELCVPKTHQGGEARKIGCHNSATAFGWEPNAKWNYDPPKWMKSPDLSTMKCWKKEPSKIRARFDARLWNWSKIEPGCYTINAPKTPHPNKILKK